MFLPAFSIFAIMKDRRRPYWMSLALLLAATLLVPADELDFNTVKSLAAKGDASAQLILGNLYLEGKGISKDSSEAAKWFRKSAEQHNARAQAALGKLYAKGDGVGKDAGAAVKWLTAAADQGRPDAQAQLGIVLRDIDQGGKNWVEAYKWLNLAAAAGDDAAARARDILASSMSAAQVAEAQKISSEFTPRIGKPVPKKKETPKKEATEAPKKDAPKIPVSKPLTESPKTNTPAKPVKPTKAPEPKK